jgi:uncharacterized membrane protein
MNSVYNILIRQVSAATSSSYDGSAERGWGQKVLNFGSGTGTGTGSTVGSVLVATINWTLGVAVIVVAIFLVNGAIQYITSTGNQDKAKEATTTIKNALIALVGILALGSLLSLLNTMIR